MSVIYVLLAISIVVAILFFTAFIVSVKKGQYDDSYTPSVRMLFEDELVIEKLSEEKQKPSLPEGRETVQSKLEQTDCRAAIAMTNNKIQLNKQE